MEIKAILNKPYTEKQRLDFIVEQNHNKGFKIKETEIALEAWGYTEEEKEYREYQNKILGKILELEGQITPRNLRNAIQGDEYAINKINEIEAEIELLRAQLETGGNSL